METNTNAKWVKCTERLPEKLGIPLRIKNGNGGYYYGLGGADMRGCMMVVGYGMVELDACEWLEEQLSATDGKEEVGNDVCSEYVEDPFYEGTCLNCGYFKWKHKPTPSTEQSVDSKTVQDGIVGWVKVEDRLPSENDADENGMVLIYRESTESQKAMSKSIMNWYMVKHCDKDSYWQSLPDKDSYWQSLPDKDSYWQSLPDNPSKTPVSQPPSPSMSSAEFYKIWKSLVDESSNSVAYLHPGSRHTLNDWHKIYDNAFFLFVERYPEYASYANQQEQWISVEDRFPEYNDEYLVRFVDDEQKEFYEVGYFNGSRFNTAYGKDGPDLSPELATHWRSLPEPPKQ